MAQNVQIITLPTPPSLCILLPAGKSEIRVDKLKCKIVSQHLGKGEGHTLWEWCNVHLENRGQGEVAVASMDTVVSLELAKDHLKSHWMEERIFVHMWLIHFAVQKKLTQHTPIKK